MDSYVTLIGLAAAVLTTFAFLPQVIKTWRTKSTADISLGTFSALCIGISLRLIYGLLIGDLPLIHRKWGDPRPGGNDPLFQTALWISDQPSFLIKPAMVSTASAQFCSSVRPEALRGLKLCSPSGRYWSLTALLSL